MSCPGEAVKINPSGENFLIALKYQIKHLKKSYI